MWAADLPVERDVSAYLRHTQVIDVECGRGGGHACAKTMRPMPRRTFPAPEAWLELLSPLESRLLAPTIEMPTCELYRLQLQDNHCT